MDDDIDWDHPQVVVGGLSSAPYYPPAHYAGQHASSSSSASFLAAPVAYPQVDPPHGGPRTQQPSASWPGAMPPPPPPLPPPREDLVDRTDFVDLLGWKEPGPSQAPSRWRAYYGEEYEMPISGKSAEQQEGSSGDDSDAPLAGPGAFLSTTTTVVASASPSDDDDDVPLHLSASRRLQSHSATSPQPLDSDNADSDDDGMLEDRTNVLLQRGYRADSPRYGRPKAFRKSASSSPTKPLTGGSRPIPASVLAARAKAEHDKAAESRKRSPPSQLTKAGGSASPVLHLPQPASNSRAALLRPERNGLTPDTAVEVSPDSVTRELSPEVEMDISPVVSPTLGPTIHDAATSAVPGSPPPAPGPPPRPPVGLGLSIAPSPPSSLSVSAQSAPPLAPQRAPTSAHSLARTAPQPASPLDTPHRPSPQGDAAPRRLSPPSHRLPSQFQPRRSPSDPVTNPSGSSKRQRESSNSDGVKRKRPAFQPLASIMVTNSSVPGTDTGTATPIKIKKRVVWKDDDQIEAVWLFHREEEYDGPDALHRHHRSTGTDNQQEGKVFREMSADTPDILQALVQATALIDWYEPLPVFVAPEDGPDLPADFSLGMNSQEEALVQALEKSKSGSSLPDDPNLRTEPAPILLPEIWMATVEEPQEPAQPPAQLAPPVVGAVQAAPHQQPIYQPPPPLGLGIAQPTPPVPQLQPQLQPQPLGYHNQQPRPLPAPQPLGLNVNTARPPPSSRGVHSPVISSPSESYGLGRERDSGWGNRRRSRDHRQDVNASGSNADGSNGWSGASASTNGRHEQLPPPSAGGGGRQYPPQGPPSGPSSYSDPAGARSYAVPPTGPSALSHATSSFTQVSTGGAKLTPQEWEVKKLECQSTPCRFWRKGQICPHGERCWYKH